jgi:hypothetical protein
MRTLIKLCTILLLLVSNTPAAQSNTSQPTSSTPAAQLNASQPTGGPSTALRLELQQHIGGYIEDLVAQGDYLYVTTRMKLAIFDVRNRSTPTQISFVPLKNCQSDLVLAGNYAYVLCNKMELYIVDIQNVAAPVTVGTITLSEQSLSFAIIENYAYIGGSSLQVVDVSNPRAPQLVASYPQFSGSVVADTNQLFVLSSDLGLRLLDRTNPLALQEQGVYQSPEMIHGAAISGRYAYVTTDKDFRVIDFADPSQPKVVGMLNQMIAGGLIVAGRYAYFNYQDQLKMIDIFDPTDPIQITLSTQIKSLSIFSVAGGYLYGKDEWARLQIIDLSTIGTPKQVFITNNALFTDLSYLLATDTYLYGSGTVFDMRDLKNPQIVGNYLGFIAHIADDYAYGFTGYNFSILSLATPTNPTLVGTLPDATSLWPSSVAIKYPYLYSDQQFCWKGICSSWGIDIFDISKREQPQKINVLDNRNTLPRGIVNNYLYATFADAIVIFDLRDPKKPVEVARYAVTQGVNDVVIRGQFAYLVNDSGLTILDIAKPTQIVERSVAPMRADRVLVTEKYAYVLGTDEQTGRETYLYVIDISDKDRPLRIASQPLPHILQPIVRVGRSLSPQMAVQNDTLYVAGNGLLAFKLAPVGLPYQLYLPMSAKKAE